MRRFYRRLLADRSGATAIEYALIASLIALVILTAVGALGQQLIATFNNITAQFP